MEHSSENLPEPQDDKRKRRSKENSFTAWLRRQRQQESFANSKQTGEHEIDEQQEDDEESEKDTRPSKIRRLFKRIFPSIVIRESVQKTEGGASPPESSEKIAPTVPEAPLSYAAEGSPSAELSSDQQDGELTAPELEAAAVEPPRSERLVDTKDSLSVASPNEHSAESHPEHEVSLHDAAVGENLEPLPLERLRPPQYPPPIEQTIFHRQKEVEAEEPLSQPVGKNIAGMAAFGAIGVVAETIGRRRADRKIRKELANVSDRAAKSHDQDASANRRTAIEQSRHQADLRLWQKAFERRSEPEKARPTDDKVFSRPIALERTGQTAETVISKSKVAEKQFPSMNEQPHKVRSFERPTEEAFERPFGSSSSETASQSAESLSRSAQLIEQQVEAAAEQNIALEGLYERRHEVKDVFDGSARAASSGVSRSGSSPATPGGSMTNVGGDANQGDFEKTAHSRASALPYRQAAQSGFWAAVVIAAIIIVIIIL